MKIELHSNFKKSYKKRIRGNSKLEFRVKERMQLFLDNPLSPTLGIHKLKGKKIALQSLSITGDIRIVYFQKSKDKVVFLDIGSHSQVY